MNIKSRHVFFFIGMLLLSSMALSFNKDSLFIQSSTIEKTVRLKQPIKTALKTHTVKNQTLSPVVAQLNSVQNKQEDNSVEKGESLYSRVIPTPIHRYPMISVALAIFVLLINYWVMHRFRLISIASKQKTSFYIEYKRKFNAIEDVILMILVFSFTIAAFFVVLLHGEGSPYFSKVGTLFVLLSVWQYIKLGLIGVLQKVFSNSLIKKVYSNVYFSSVLYFGSFLTAWLLIAFLLFRWMEAYFNFILLGVAVVGVISSLFDYVNRNKRNIRFPILQFFLYLCVVEFFPILLITKYFII